MKKLNVHHLLFVIFKHKWTILVVWALVVTIVTAGSFIIKPTYEATTRIAIKVEYELKRPLSSGMELSPEKHIKSELETLKGGAIIRELINDIGLQQLYPNIYVSYLENRNFSSTEQAIVTFQENLKTKVSSKSDSISVSFRHSSPSIAAQAVNKLVEHLIKRHVPPVIAQPETPEQRTVQVKKSMIAIKNPENTGLDRASNEGTQSLLKEKEDLRSKIAASEEELSKTNTKISSTEAKAQDLKARLSVSQKRAGIGEITVSGGESVDVIRQRLEQLRQKEERLLKSYKDTSGPVTLVRQEIMQEEKLLAREESVEYRRALAITDQELKALRTRAASLKTDIGQNRIKLAKVDHAIEVATAMEIQREAERVKEEAARNVAQNPNIHVRVLEEALPPSKPIWPIIPLNVGLAIIFGFMLGVCAAFIAEHHSHTFNVPEDVEEYLGIRVLASVSQPQLQERKNSE